MKKALLLTVAIAVMAPSWAQITLPCTFEGNPTTADFTDFDGGVAEVVANPAPDANNGSDFVARIVRGPGALWSGSLLTLANPAPFGEESGLRMKIWSPEANIFVRIKFESDMGSIELDQYLVEAGTWKVLEWDFSNGPADQHDRLVFMIDVGTEGDGSVNSTFYIDDVEWFDADGSLPQPSLPLTWDEFNVYQHTYAFAGSASWFAADPQNPTNTVVEVLKTSLAFDYSGVVLTNRNGLANPIPFTATEQVLQARIWSPDVGLPILMKVENKDNPAVFAQTLATTTAVGWDTLSFDFTQPTEGTPGIDLTASYDLPVVFFNFGYTGELFGPLTFRIDEVALGALGSSTGITESQTDLHLVNQVVAAGQPLVWTGGFQGNATARVLDLNGHVLSERGLNNGILELPELATGCYLVWLQLSDGSMHSERFIVR